MTTYNYGDGININYSSPSIDLKYLSVNSMFQYILSEELKYFNMCQSHKSFNTLYKNIKNFFDDLIKNKLGTQDKVSMESIIIYTIAKIFTEEFRTSIPGVIFVNLYNIYEKKINIDIIDALSSNFQELELVQVEHDVLRYLRILEIDLKKHIMKQLKRDDNHYKSFFEIMLENNYIYRPIDERIDENWKEVTLDSLDSINSGLRSSNTWVVNIDDPFKYTNPNHRIYNNTLVDIDSQMSNFYFDESKIKNQLTINEIHEEKPKIKFKRIEL